MPSSETQQLDHKTIKAAAVATDKGQFSAIAAAYTVDRVQERIIPGAFGKTIAAWTASQKNVPLHWDHQGSADSIIGYVSSMHEQDQGLYVEGQLDIETSDIAKEAWRSMKNNAVSLSFGYLAKSRKGKDGITELTEIDLFEVSIVPAPANADTRFLSLKNAEGATAIRTEESVDVTPDAIVTPEDLSAEAWKLVLKDEPKVTEPPKPDAPKSLARFPDVQTEDDFKALTFHDKLAVYYAGLDDEDTESAKAVWGRTFVDQLPDTSFLYRGKVTEANEKGTTTEDRRCFPVKDADGKTDVPHLRDALSRIPLSNLPQKAKDRLTAEARDALKKIASEPPKAVEDGNDEEPKAKSTPQDPLVTEAWNLIAPRSTGPRVDPTPEPEPEPLDPAQVQREAWALSLKTSGT